MAVPHPHEMIVAMSRLIALRKVVLNKYFRAAMVLR